MVKLLFNNNVFSKQNYTTIASKLKKSFYLLLLKYHRNTFAIADLQVDYDTQKQTSHNFHKYSLTNCQK